jgi:RND family efflux transporter MFP subunit
LKLRRVLKRLLQVALLLGFVAVLLAFAGVFRTGLVEPGTLAAPPGLPAPAEVFRAERVQVPVVYEAVGTVRSRIRVDVAPQVGGQILALEAVAGQRVDKGAELARLETAEVEARLGQARGARAAAEAARKQAADQRARVLQLYDKNAATPEQRDSAEAAFQRAEAELAAASQRVTEAEIALSRTRVTSPIAGVVAERLAEPGDLAWPGKPLFVVHDPADLRLEADVREGLYGRVRAGEEVALRFPALGLETTGTVDEVVPAADAVSRSFLVKVALPDADGLVPGMFGRLSLPLDDREAVLVPEAAIRRVGQLTTVRVKQDGRWERRHVTLGAAFGDRREVLSGLDGGEELGRDE